MTQRFSQKFRLFLASLAAAFGISAAWAGNNSKRANAKFSESFSPDSYTVKSGETLSEIVWRRYGSPLYGKHGRLLQVIKRNASRIADPHRVYPGDVIEFLEVPVASQCVVPAQTATFPAAQPVADRSLASVAEPTSVSSADYVSWSEYVFSADTYFANVTSRDLTSSATASFYTKENFGFSTQWRQHWDERFSTELGLGVRAESWDERFSPGRTYNSQSYLNTSYHAGAAYDLNRSFGVDTKIGAAEHTFRHSPTATSIVFETPVLFELHAGAHYELPLKDAYSLLSKVDGVLLLPRSMPIYNVELSPGVKLELMLKQVSQGGGSYLAGGVFFEMQKLKSSILNDTQSSLGLGITFGFGTNPNSSAKKEDENKK